MKIFLFCALIFCLETAFAKLTIQASYQSPVNQSVTFQLKKPLVLSCVITPEPEDISDIGIDWKFQNVSVLNVPTLKNRVKFSNEGFKHTMTVNDGSNDEVGNWSCHALLGGTDQDHATITVGTTIAVKIKTDNINVVEEEKLRIECSVLGNPLPRLFWRIETNNYNGTDFYESDERVKIENYKDDNDNVIENGVLIIEKMNKEDRGLYYCNATNTLFSNNTEISHSMIRVKDKYAALWPFLGICAEVIVLCAVIIIYEKKRNKTEMEESDTDQSPDQKNTPDHGKEANLRHRQ